MRTAVVHDWLNGMRGGEKVLEAILPLVPEPTIFTLFHVPGSVSPAIERRPIVVSDLNHLPFAQRGYRNYLPLFPKAVESFDLSGFDLVVSSSHCVAKGAIAPRRRAAPLLLPHARPLRVRAVRPLLPARDGRASAVSRPPPSRGCAPGTSRRPAGRRATSPTPPPSPRGSAATTDARREVCHPPVDVTFYEGPRRRAARGDFLLAVGALVPYKRYDVAIEAARRARPPARARRPRPRGDRVSALWRRRP